MFKHKAFLIETLTNTHVGSGDTTYGIVDNMIQKDVTTSIPVFHPSSIKGAIRDHFEQYKDDVNFQPAGSDKVKPFTLYAIFGGEEVADRDKLEEELKKADIGKVERKKINKDIELLRKAPAHGLIKFYEARLLTLPLRSSTRVYHNATCPEAVLDYLNNLIKFKTDIGSSGINEVKNLQAFFVEVNNYLEHNKGKDFIVFSAGKNAPMIEEFEDGECVPPPADRNTDQAEGFWKGFKYDEIKELIQKYLTPHTKTKAFISTLAIFRNELFSQICDFGLPVIARNSLDEKGISENLFYEEILPRRSVLWFMTGTYDHFFKKEENSFSGAFDFFEKRLIRDNIQMGANASIGYGVTSIKRVGGKKNE